MLGFQFSSMGSSEFNEIINEIVEDIMRMDTVMHDSVTPKETGGHCPLSRIR